MQRVLEKLEQKKKLQGNTTFFILIIQFIYLYLSAYHI